MVLFYHLNNKQYIKSETVFNIRMKKYGKYIKNTDAILDWKHLEQQGHSFNSHLESISIGKQVNTCNASSIYR